MTSPEGADGRPRGTSTGRLEAFSDGVFAIAITILVLELGLGAGAEDDLLGAFLAQWPAYLAYVVAFSTIGAAWMAHSVITEYVDRSDEGFARINLILLMLVSFLSFPTKLLGEFVAVEGAERVAVTIFGANLLLIAVVLSVLWRHAVKRSLIRPDMSDVEVTILTERLTPGLVGYGAFIVLGLFFPFVAVLGYFLIALALMLPLRRRR